MFNRNCDKPRNEIPQEIPISESDHIVVQITREDGSVFEDDFYDFLEMISTFIAMEYCEPHMYFTAAEFFLLGKSGVPIDKRRGYYYLIYSARSGYARAQYLLGISYLDPSSLYGKHIPTAVYWLNEAAKQNYPNAKETLRSIHKL